MRPTSVLFSAELRGSAMSDSDAAKADGCHGDTGSVSSTSLGSAKMAASETLDSYCVTTESDVTSTSKVVGKVEKIEGAAAWQFVELGSPVGVSTWHLFLTRPDLQLDKDVLRSRRQLKLRSVYKLCCKYFFEKKIMLARILFPFFENCHFASRQSHKQATVYFYLYWKYLSNQSTDCFRVNGWHDSTNHSETNRNKLCKNACNLSSKNNLRMRPRTMTVFASSQEVDPFIGMSAEDMDTLDSVLFSGDDGGHKPLDENLSSFDPTATAADETTAKMKVADDVIGDLMPQVGLSKDAPNLLG